MLQAVQPGCRAASQADHMLVWVPSGLQVAANGLQVVIGWPPKKLIKSTASEANASKAFLCRL